MQCFQVVTAQQSSSAAKRTKPLFCYGAVQHPKVAVAATLQGVVCHHPTPCEAWQKNSTSECGLGNTRKSPLDAAGSPHARPGPGRGRRANQGSDRTGEAADQGRNRGSESGKRTGARRFLPRIGTKPAAKRLKKKLSERQQEPEYLPWASPAPGLAALTGRETRTAGIEGGGPQPRIRKEFSFLWIELDGFHRDRAG
jgi:hypothetical protein